MAAINVYGTDWCEDTQRTRQRLDEIGVAYRYINIEKDPAARQWVVKQNHGKQKTPTVQIADEILVEPENAELDAALRRHGLVV